MLPPLPFHLSRLLDHLQLWILTKHHPESLSLTRQPRARLASMPDHVYHVSDDVVVWGSCAINASDSKHYKHHGSGVYQRPHCWLPTACVHAWIKSRCGRQLCFGCFLTGNIQDAFVGSVWARAEQTAWRCNTHSAVVRGLVRLGKIQFPCSLLLLGGHVETEVELPALLGVTGQGGHHPLPGAHLLKQPYWNEGTSPSPGDTICQGAGTLALSENL